MENLKNVFSRFYFLPAGYNNRRGVPVLNDNNGIDVMRPEMNLITNNSKNDMTSKSETKNMNRSFYSNYFVNMMRNNKKSVFLLPGGGISSCSSLNNYHNNSNNNSTTSATIQPEDTTKPIAFSKKTDTSSSSQLLQNTKASDYATPEKYLEDPSKIPSFYVFQSNMITDEDLKPGMLRNLEVDKRLTLPTRTHIRFLITATDVIHSWAVPSLGIKADAVPGRLQRINTFIQREGVYYGQCSELCGSLHGFMPIVVEAVSPETYAAHAKKWYTED